MTPDATGTGHPGLDGIKKRLAEEVDRLGGELCALAGELWDDPELAYGEHHAHDRLTAALEAEGLEVTRNAHGLETAFSARAGQQGPTIAVLCEYDALPGMGHACGHNVIAAAGLGAGVAAARVAAEAGGRVVVLGTPAEEGGGGKILMADDGALANIDAAMMVHPAGADLRRMNIIAIDQCEVVYHGEAAHAAAAPHKGRNALDAAVAGYNNIAMLRQHIRPSERIHGIITDGGQAPNVVPERAAATWYVRSATLASLEPLWERVVACLEAGAEAAGCTMELSSRVPTYADMVDNVPMLNRYTANMAELGREVAEPDSTRVVGSTDMGNVSYQVPAIHPLIKVSPPDVAIHTPAFADHTRGPAADAAVLDGAKAMAMTVADLWLDPDALAAAATSHTEDLSRR